MTNAPYQMPVRPRVGVLRASRGPIARAPSARADHPSSPRRAPHVRVERGTTLVELMIALVVLGLGVLAVSQLFPAGSQGQLKDRLLTTASFHAQEKIEQLAAVSWTDPTLNVGSHPVEAVGPNGRLQRSYKVSVLPGPLSDMKRVDVTVRWAFLGSKSITASTYFPR